MFASKTPRDLSNDPAPHITKKGNRVKYPWLAPGGAYGPRPEFDHKQHNEPNPILVWARERHDAGEDYGTILWRMNNGGASGTDAQYTHARRVLTRLAALS